MDMTTMTAAQLIAVHNERCPEAERLTTWKASKAALVKKIDALGAATTKPTKAEAAEKAKRAPDGSISASVRRLLADPKLSYSDIVELVKAAHPEAETTPRSIASIASVLRKKGADVPMRRSAKGAN